MQILMACTEPSSLLAFTRKGYSVKVIIKLFLDTCFDNLAYCCLPYIDVSALEVGSDAVYDSEIEEADEH